jgi:hypothetical protein
MGLFEKYEEARQGVSEANEQSNAKWERPNTPLETNKAPLR